MELKIIIIPMTQAISIVIQVVRQDLISPHVQNVLLDGFKVVTVLIVEVIQQNVHITRMVM